MPLKFRLFATLFGKLTSGITPSETKPFKSVFLWITLIYKHCLDITVANQTDASRMKTAVRTTNQERTNALCSVHPFLGHSSDIQLSVSGGVVNLELK